MKINKLLILFGVAIIFLVGSVNTVNAFEFDNIKNYNEETRTVDIRNSILGIPFLQLGKVAEIELKTPLIYQVPRGYQKVAEFEVNAFSDYTNAFKELELYDKNDNDRKFIRTFDYKYKTFENVNVDDYGLVSVGRYPNGTDILETQKVGSHRERKEVWNDLNESNFKSGESLTIGIFTIVEKGDVVEWIPNFFGVRISEWSVWTESLNADLLTYYTLDETSGNYPNSVDANYEGVVAGGQQGVVGKIGLAYFTSGAGEFTNLTGLADNLTNSSYSVNAWVLANSSGSGQGFWIHGATGGKGFGIGINSNSTALYFHSGGKVLSSPASIRNDSFIMVTGVYDGTTKNLYINGVSVANQTDSYTVQDSADYLLARFTTVEQERWEGVIDEVAIYNRSLEASLVQDLYNNGTGITFVDLNIILNSPANDTVFLANNVTFNTTIGVSDLRDVTLFLDGVANETNSSGLITDYIFEKNLSLGTHTWSIGTEDNSNQTINSSTRTFRIGSIIGSLVFNGTSFETARETYTVNITSFNGLTPTNATLNFEGTEVSATIVNIVGDNFSLSASQDVPIGFGERILNFTFNTDSNFERTSSSNQTINETILALCNSTIGTSYINFTFKNETLVEDNVNATIDTTWNFFLGSGTTTKTFSFSNATENPSYAFCLQADNKTLSTRVNVSYTNSISQQRQFRPTLLTLSNATLNQVLYLLPTAEGIFAQFRTQDNIGNTLVGVLATITRTLNGNPITSGIDVTDGAGLVSFFLDPDINYNAVFSFSGFNDNAFSFNPTSDLTTIVMGGVAAPGEGSNITLGTQFNITPISSTLQNGTAVTFQFNVSSTETITFMGFVISNGTDNLLFVNQTSNGSISGVLNTGTNRTFTGVFTFNTSEESITITRIWPIVEGFLGDYSIQRQGDLFLEYEFSDFIRLLIIVAFIIAVMIFISGPSDLDDELRIAVMISMVWFFSFIGWLDTGLQVTTASSNINALTQFSNQFGIAMLTTAAGFYFILRRTLRQI